MSASVLHLSDIHAVAQPGATVYGEDPDANLEHVVDAALREAGAFDLVLVTGDVADDATVAAYRRVRRILTGVGTQFRWVPGNHDRPELMAVVDAAALEPATVGSWRLVTVDTLWSGHTPGRATQAELGDLSTQLLDSEGRHVVVALHHPPHPPCLHPDCQLTDRVELLEVLRRHRGVRAVLSGHCHRSFHTRRDHIDWIGAPSTCMQIDHPDHSPTSEPPGAHRLDLHDDGTMTVTTMSS